jgi:hypothetical protein
MRLLNPRFAALLSCAALAAAATANAADAEEYGEAGPPVAARADATARNAVVAGVTVASSRSLLSSLQSFLHERAVDVNELDAESMVVAMSEWFRLVPASGGAVSDALVFRYGGWSEGCATGFKLSLLRRVVPRGGEGERLAGITLLFDPAGLTQLEPASLASTDSPSLEAFLLAVRESRAFKTLAGGTPMSAMTESGALR